MNNKIFYPKDVDSIYSPYDYSNGVEPTEWTQIAFFNKLNIGIIGVNGWYGAINKNGEIIIPLEYDNLIDFEELESTHILAKKADLWGYISWENKILIQFEYSYASIFQDNEALVCKDGNYFFIDKENQFLRRSDGLKKI